MISVMPPNPVLDESAAAAEEDREQYSHGQLSFEELDEKYEDRPRNTQRTLPFHELFKSLFDPLMDNKNSKARKGKLNKLSLHEQRRQVIIKFISRWRSEVGNDFYPALRLIIPDKDRDRAMYGLKEKAIARLLIKLLKINPKSDDGDSLINWKVPGKTGQNAGDFPGRCFQVLSKRAMMNDVGDMRIAEVNILLDRLSAAQKEENQLPIFEKFYERMNATELTWLIRIILRQMKIGASENTILVLWHPDGEALFNVSSSLRRVCWQLTDPGKRLGGENHSPPIELMTSFQPQLAQFQSHSFQVMVQKLGCAKDDPRFWIEEKLDGERMQLHMEEDESHPGGKRFVFYSRKAKDYTYLYGNGFQDKSSALTQHIKDAFPDEVRNIILDGEMITWDPIAGKMVPFGTLKTAANSERENPFGGSGHRPLFRVFDCLYLNDKVLTPYMLRDRRAALQRAVKNVEQRIEIHEYEEVTTVDAISPALRRVVEEASEGLVLKNPRSTYRLNSRNDEWMKVKPEYMSEFGESLDCVIIGGYYGSGHRGGGLSSFLCGLRVSQNYRDSHPGTHPEKCVSFFKVGGGFRAGDYGEIKERLSGSWIEWNSNRPPDDYIILGGDGKQAEKPDVWIKPSDSIIVEVKAASVGASTSFGAGITLRFPRFKKFRFDKSWETSLSVDEFLVLKSQAEESKEKDFIVDKKRRATKKLKKELEIAGNDRKIKTAYAGPKTQVFEGLNFCVFSDMLKPQKKSKTELEQMIKANGGNIFQNSTARENMICVGEKRVIKVASLIKGGHTDIVKPVWLLDAIKQQFLIPFEPSHMFHITNKSQPGIYANVDVYGDSFTRDTNPQELKLLLDDMIHPKNSEFSAQEFITELEERGKTDGGLGDLRASIFRGCVVRFSPSEPQTLDLRIAKYQFQFAGGNIAEDDNDARLSHFVVAAEDEEAVRGLRTKVATLVGSVRKLPRIVGLAWLTDSWKEGTLLDEERYANLAR